jgi:transcriptional regulator with XRE-family HTH domain
MVSLQKFPLAIFAMYGNLLIEAMRTDYAKALSSATHEKHQHPKPMTKTPLGEFIRERRTALRMTQRKLAQLIGLKAPSHLCDVENGSRQLGEEYLPRLAAVLNVTPEELELHDPRAPLSQARELFDKDARYIVALHRVVQQAKHLSPEEIIRRINTVAPSLGAMPTPGDSPPPGET